VRAEALALNGWDIELFLKEIALLRSSQLLARPKEGDKMYSLFLREPKKAIKKKIQTITI
jgi:hypothetical protein